MLAGVGIVFGVVLLLNGALLTPLPAVLVGAALILFGVHRVLKPKRAGR